MQITLCQSFLSEKPEILDFGRSDSIFGFVHETFVNQSSAVKISYHYHCQGKVNWMIHCVHCEQWTHIQYLFLWPFSAHVQTLGFTSGIRGVASKSSNRPIKTFKFHRTHFVLLKTRPCTTVRDSEDILEQSSFRKFTACWVFLALYFAFAHLTHGNMIFDTLEQSLF